MDSIEHLNLTTPSLLFSAISLILLAYTNRFLSYATVVRNLKEKYENDPEKDPTSLAQIRNFVTRLKLIRAMQILGAGSLLFCISSMFFIYIKVALLAHIIFGAGMLMLAASLVLCIIEIQISTEALSLHLHSIRQRQRDKDGFTNNSFRRIANRRESESLSEHNTRKQQEKQRLEREKRNREKAQQDTRDSRKKERRHEETRNQSAEKGAQESLPPTIDAEVPEALVPPATGAEERRPQSGNLRYRRGRRDRHIQSEQMPEQPAQNLERRESTTDLVPKE